MVQLTCADIIHAMRAAFEPLDYVHAMWEAGSAAFNRADEYSDLDLQIVVDDDCIPDAVALATQTLESLSPITLRYDMPQPTWHTHWQTFYHLRDTTEYLMIDLVVMKLSAPDKFLQPEIHGNALVLFDKSGVVRAEPLDPAAEQDRLRKRVEALRLTFDLFFPFPEKELRRGNTIEAITFYQNLLLRPLVEALRIKHQPFRNGFHTRYIHYDLLPEVVRELEPLFYVASPNDLRQKRERVRVWFGEVIDELRQSYLIP